MSPQSFEESPEAPGRSYGDSSEALRLPSGVSNANVRHPAARRRQQLTLPSVIGATVQHGMPTLLHRTLFAIEPGEDGWFITIVDGGHAEEAICALTRRFRRGGKPVTVLHEGLLAASNEVTRARQEYRKASRLGSSVQWLNPVSATVAHIGQRSAAVLWVGATMAFLIRGSQVHLKTTPHVAPTTTRSTSGARVVRNLLQRSLDQANSRPEALPELWSLAAGDRLILCSENVGPLLTNGASKRYLALSNGPASMFIATLLEDATDPPTAGVIIACA